MARKITEKAINNFLHGHAFTLQNTSVILDGNKVKLLLWGNCIAYYDKNEKSVYFSLCGYNTNTTRERLRGLGLNIRTRAGVIYWGKHEIDAYKYHDSGIIAFLLKGETMNAETIKAIFDNIQSKKRDRKYAARLRNERNILTK